MPAPVIAAMLIGSNAAATSVRRPRRRGNCASDRAIGLPLCAAKDSDRRTCMAHSSAQSSVQHRPS